MSTQAHTISALITCVFRSRILTGAVIFLHRCDVDQPRNLAKSVTVE
jgi:glucosamine 6-phosphate synthetase-like amidotransferase/phosphosugar isomerase protein